MSTILVGVIAWERILYAVIILAGYVPLLVLYYWYRPKWLFFAYSALVLSAFADVLEIVHPSTIFLRITNLSAIILVSLFYLQSARYGRKQIRELTEDIKKHGRVKL